MDIVAKRARALACCQEVIDGLDEHALDVVLADEAMFKVRLGTRIAMSRSEGYPTEVKNGK